MRAHRKRVGVDDNRCGVDRLLDLRLNLLLVVAAEVECRRLEVGLNIEHRTQQRHALACCDNGIGRRFDVKGRLRRRSERVRKV